MIFGWLGIPAMSVTVNHGANLGHAKVSRCQPACMLSAGPHHHYLNMSRDATYDMSGYDIIIKNFDLAHS